jgi:hypothetical protein
MTSRTLAWGLVSLGLLTFGGAGCNAPPGGSDAGSDVSVATDGARDANVVADGGTDAAPADASDGAPAGTCMNVVPPDAGNACEARRVATTPECGDNCEGALHLPGGMRFCTNMCGTDSDCAALGSCFRCPDTVGACVPACTADAQCTAMGFARCDMTTGACDTQ